MMASSQLGLKAQGLCIQPLLQHGIPGTEVIECVIREIDDTLSHNNRQLEECIRELLTMTDEVVPREERFANPVDALTVLNEARILDKATCYDPDNEEISKILKNAVGELEKSPGCEENLLERLLQLSSQEGLNLPTKSSATSSINHSMMSINTVTDQSEQMNDTLWNDLTIRLRRYFLDRLASLPVGESVPKVDLHSPKRLYYMQCLCALFPASEIWPRYRSLRCQQFETLCQQRPSSKRAPISFMMVVNHVESLAAKMLNMICEDFELLNSGIFAEQTPVMKAIHDIYIDRITEEILVAAEVLNDELNCVPGSKEMPKSSSEFGRISHLRGALRKQHSRSLDNLTAKMEDGGSEVELMSRDQLEGLVRLVKNILGVQSYLHTLRNAMMWECLGNQKPTPKGSLKSVLKVSNHETSGASEEEGESEGLSSDTNNKPPFSRSFEQAGILPDSIPSPFGTSEDMDEETTASSFTIIEKSQMEVCIPWDWQSAFKKVLVDIGKGVEMHVRCLTGQAQRTLLADLQTSEKMETTQVPSELVGGRLDYPRLVHKCLYETIQEIEWMLPLAAAGAEGNFHVIHSAFTDAVTLSLKEIYVSMTKVCGGITERKLPIQCLLTILSTAAYYRNHLLHFDTVLGNEDTSKKRFGGLYRQYCELVDSLSRSLIEYHTQLVITGLLQDADSHDWSHHKEFYEDEKCSFSIQMWHLHMTGIHFDLWHYCPPKLAQSVLGAVLQETLTVLAQRYATIRPSYKRTKQFRRDITTILLVASELLYPVCSSVSKYLDPCAAYQPSYTIHNCCANLLATMAVVSSPIDTLYKVYKKGFYRKRWKTDDDYPSIGYPSQWLTCVQPALFQIGVTNIEELQTTAAMYLSVKLLAAQPEVNWPLLLHSLLMKEYAVPIMLLAQAAQEACQPPDDSPDQNRPSQGVVVFHAFVDVLIQVVDFPNALTSVLLPVIERTSTWEIFNTVSVLGKTHPIPPFIQAIFTCLESFFIRVIEPALRVMVEREHAKPPVESLVSGLNELPCGCPPINTKDEHEPSKDPLGEALYSLVTQLVEDVYTLPTPVCTLFKVLQEKLNEKNIKAPHNCVGIKMLASGVRIALSDQAYLEKLLGQPLSDNLKGQLKMLEVCAYHVLTATSYGKGSGTPRIAGMFMKANRNWLQEQVEIITDHFGNEIFALSNKNPYENASAEFLENLFITTASFILHTESGPESLPRVYNFVVNNTEWVLSQLDIPPLITTYDPFQFLDPKFLLSTSPRKERFFNPLRIFNHIGDARLDHRVVGEWPYEWNSLLQSDLGLTEASFRTLLQHRHEFQEGAFLEEVEMKPVQVLKSKFGLDVADLS